MKLQHLLNPDELAKEVEAGHVTRKRHSTLPLSLYVYDRICQYDNLWNDVTMKTRGLIVDDETNDIVAIPFPKIFVKEMHDPERGYDFAPALPNETFEIFDKVDGSLIILFYYANNWHAATKGSFDSVQSRMADAILYAHDINGVGLDRGVTYLAELIEPSNRIVCDYGDTTDLVLLAGFRPQDGTEVPLYDLAHEWSKIGTVVSSFGLSSDISKLVESAARNEHKAAEGVVDGTDAEGYVIRFANGQRSKIKLLSYLKLHKLFTGTNEKTIWEVLASGQDPSVLFDTAPDEYAGWVRGVANELQRQHDAVLNEAQDDYFSVLTSLQAEDSLLDDRKAFAVKAVKSQHKSALFLMYDDRGDKLDSYCWQNVKPSGEKPFKVDEDG